MLNTNVFSKKFLVITNKNMKVAFGACYVFVLFIDRAWSGKFAVLLHCFSISKATLLIHKTSIHAQAPQQFANVNLYLAHP